MFLKDLAVTWCGARDQQSFLECFVTHTELSDTPMGSLHIHIALYQRKKKYSSQNDRLISSETVSQGKILNHWVGNHLLIQLAIWVIVSLEGVARHLANKHDILSFLWMWGPLVERAWDLILQTLIFWCMLCILSTYETGPLPVTPLRQLLSTGSCQDMVLFSLTLFSTKTLI